MIPHPRPTKNAASQDDEWEDVTEEEDLRERPPQVKGQPQQPQPPQQPQYKMKVEEVAAKKHYVKKMESEEVEKQAPQLNPTFGKKNTLIFTHIKPQRAKELIAYIKSLTPNEL